MKKIPRLSDYYVQRDGTEVETVPECSTESRTDVNVSQTSSPPRDAPLAGEDSSEDCAGMIEPRVSPSRDLPADQDSNDDSNENPGWCGTLVLRDRSHPSGSDYSYNKLVDNPIEMEGLPSRNSQIIAYECSDPALWPSVLTDEHRKLFVEKGPYRLENYEYPTDENGRQFVERHYDRYLANGEIINRVWLVYSPSTDRVFCFCCKLFRSNEKIALVTEGLCDWKNIGSRLNEHEVSKKHLECMQN